jgi:hypothetical protein
MEADLHAAIKMLQGQCHTVRPYIRYGTLWFEIDSNMLATRQEMLELAEGVYSCRNWPNYSRAGAPKKRAGPSPDAESLS